MKTVVVVVTMTAGMDPERHIQEQGSERSIDSWQPHHFFLRETFRLCWPMRWKSVRVMRTRVAMMKSMCLLRVRPLLPKRKRTGRVTMRTTVLIPILVFIPPMIEVVHFDVTSVTSDESEVPSDDGDDDDSDQHHHHHHHHHHSHFLVLILTHLMTTSHRHPSPTKKKKSTSP
jgi:hypothetical protein